MWLSLFWFDPVWFSVVWFDPLWCLSTAGLSGSSVAVSGGQSLAFTAPSSPVHGPTRLSPAGPLSVSAPQSPCLALARSQGDPWSRGNPVVERQLEETSSSLAAALKAVEKKLSQEDISSRSNCLHSLSHKQSETS